MKNNLKRILCNKLIKENLVQEGDCIRHSYSTNRLNKMYTQNSVDKDTSPTLDTRCDCLGVVVNDMSCECVGGIGEKKSNGGTQWYQQDRIYKGDESISVTTTCNPYYIVEENKMNNLRIRKLTPKEYFRLMGVKDEDSDKLNHLSNATKYHLAGDSIVVNVLQAIFKSILIDRPVLDDKPIRLIEFFSGYGSQALALKYLGIPFEHWKTCEWAINSIDAYKHIHFPNVNEDYNDLMDKDDLVEYLYKKGISSNWNEPMKKESIQRKSEKELREIYNNIKIIHNLVNIQQVHAEDLEIKERDKYNYILTYSFPCQDLSLAGKTAGMKKGSGTRSGMLWEVERILEECGEELPQILLMENVPQVVGKKNKEDFDKWLEFLESKGYTNKYCMLNAKEVGYPEPIPQNRNRCFMISVLNPKCDIIFPEKTERTKVLKDLLEENVDEKYYLSDKMLDYCYGVNQKESKFPRGERFKQTLDMVNNKGIGATVTTNAGSRPVDNFIIDSYNKSLQETLETNEIKQDVSYVDSYNKKIRDDNISGTITTRVDASNNSYLLIKNATKQGYLEANDGDGVDISSRMQYHRGNVQKGIIQTITTSGGTDRGVVTNTTSEDKWSDLD